MAQPIWRTRAGSISCAIWENEANVNGQKRTILKATVERRYKDADGNWKSTGSFSRRDIPDVRHCLAKAFEKMTGEEQQDDTVPVEEVR